VANVGLRASRRFSSLWDEIREATSVEAIARSVELAREKLPSYPNLVFMLEDFGVERARELGFRCPPRRYREADEDYTIRCATRLVLGPEQLGLLETNPSSHSFQFWSDCVGMPGGCRAGELVNAIRDHPESRRVTYDTFARHVDLEPLREMGHGAMYRISAPSNWAVSFHRSRLPSGQRVYYFVWSGIEHFFVEEEPNLELELELLDR